ncbi:MAG: rod-binding protein [Candidatus Margulisbacteria bacterium]|nr:rod-binding protein [Candidatus Margulisiibacteriota bacterium]
MNIMDVANINKSELAAKDLKASKDLEGFFVHFLLKEMRKTIPKSDLFGKSDAEEMYVDMLDQQIAQNIANGGGFGLAKQINASLANKQKAAENYGEVQKIINS